MFLIESNPVQPAISRRNFLLLGMMAAVELSKPVISELTNRGIGAFADIVQEHSNTLQASRRIAPLSDISSFNGNKITQITEEEYKREFEGSVEYSDLGNDRKTITYMRPAGPFIFELLHHGAQDGLAGTLAYMPLYPNVAQYDQENKLLGNIYLDSLENPISQWAGDLDSFWTDAVDSESEVKDDELTNYQGKHGVLVSNKDTTLNDVNDSFINLAHFTSNEPWVSAIDTPQLMNYLFYNRVGSTSGENAVYTEQLFDAYKKAVSERNKNAQGVILSLLAGIFLVNSGSGLGTIKKIVNTNEFRDTVQDANIDTNIIDYLQSHQVTRREFLKSLSRGALTAAGIYEGIQAANGIYDSVNSQKMISETPDRITELLEDSYFSNVSMESLPNLADTPFEDIPRAYRGMLESIIYSDEPDKVHPGLIVIYLRDLIGAYKTHVLSKQVNNDFGQSEQMSVWGSEHYRQIGLHDLPSEQIFNYIESFFYNYSEQIKQIVGDPLIRASLYTAASYRYKVNEVHDDLVVQDMGVGGVMKTVPDDDFVPYIEKTDCIVHRFTKLEDLVNSYLA